jgi:natural product precursor
MKKIKVLKLNKEAITELSSQKQEKLQGGYFLSMGQRCSCHNSCDRPNIPQTCCGLPGLP